METAEGLRRMWTPAEVGGDSPEVPSPFQATPKLSPLPTFEMAFPRADETLVAGKRAVSAAGFGWRA